MPLRFVGITIISLVLLTSGVIQANENPPAPVSVAKAQLRTIAPHAWFAGAVISRNNASIPAEVEGRLVWVAEVGTSHHKGDVVARLDDSIIRQQLIEHESLVNQEQARLQFLKREAERLQQLALKSNAAQSRLEEVLSDLEVTSNALTAARARVEQAKQYLTWTTVRAPFDGVLSERFLQNGEWVDSGMAILRLVDPDDLQIQAWISGDTLAYLKQGTPLSIQAVGHDLGGTVATILPVANPRTRLHELRIALEGAVLPVGQPVRVAVPTAAQREVVTIPRDAMVLRREGVLVFRVGAEQKAEAVMITSGIADGANIEVLGDIRVGDLVVVRGGERLTPGQPVRILDDGTTP